MVSQYAAVEDKVVSRKMLTCAVKRVSAIELLNSAVEVYDQNMDSALSVYAAMFSLTTLVSIKVGTTPRPMRPRAAMAACHAGVNHMTKTVPLTRSGVWSSRSVGLKASLVSMCLWRVQVIYSKFEEGGWEEGVATSGE